MKKYLLLLLIAALGCKKSQTGTAVFDRTVLEQVKKAPDLTLMSAALSRLQFDTAFAGGGPYTLFAPVDSAFANAGWSLNRINSINIDSLRDIIRYHVVIGKVSSSTLPGYLHRRFVSLNVDAFPYIVKNYYGIFIDGRHVDDGNILCTDGVLHKIGRTCVPSTGNLYTTLLRQPRLSYFDTLVEAGMTIANVPIHQLLTAKPDSFYYSQNFGDSDPYGVKPLFSDFTLLIPTDHAFRSAGLTLDSLRYLLLNDRLTLENDIVNGVLCGHAFSSEFHGGFVINRAFRNGNPEAYSYGGGTDLWAIMNTDLYHKDFAVGPGSGILYNQVHWGHLTEMDIAANNGVIHILDTVMVRLY